MPANQHHTEYAPPVLRAPSPASSIGTVYGEDRTSYSDCEEQISQSLFEAKWEERLALHLPRLEEVLADQDPLLPRHLPNSVEERQLFEEVLERLHQTVHDLEDNELFERTLLRGSQAALEPLPSTNDIDALMRSMMVTPQPPANVTSEPNPPQGQLGSRTDGTMHGSWNVNGHGAQTDPNGSLLSTGIVPGKRSRNGSRRN
ncbi:hypothetical protein C0992_004736 [Termitomyces sp. T32_za158]|nr:hypothetical protein C0992_004736 [Termitomyces sp. T32_za158]